MDVPEIFGELGRILQLLFRKYVEVIQYGRTVVVANAGEPAGYLFVFIIAVVVPFFLLSILFSRIQAFLELSHAKTSGWAIRLVLIGILMFLMMFILSQS